MLQLALAILWARSTTRAATSTPASAAASALSPAGTATSVCPSFTDSLRSRTDASSANATQAAALTTTATSSQASAGNNKMRFFYRQSAYFLARSSCRPHVTGRTCNHPEQSYFSGYLDYNVYEAEFAKGSDVSCALLTILFYY